MSCTHKHVVIHRDTVEHHNMQDGVETGCSCGPGLVCPVCDWDMLYHGCFITAPEEVVDEFLVPPPDVKLN